MNNIFSAVKNHDSKALKDAINSGTDINAKNHKGITALMGAAWMDDISILDCLIKNGADIDAKDLDGNTALVYATDEKNWPSIEYLIAHNATIYL